MTKTKDQQTTPIPEELYNLTQLAEVTLAASRLSTTNIKEIKDYMNSQEPQPKPALAMVAYASSDDDSNYYSHKVFDRRKQRRCTMSDSNSCASNSSSSLGSSSAPSGEDTGQSHAANKGLDGTLALGLLEDEHICPECGKKYSTSSNLARHRQTHRSIMDKKARHCPHCEKVYVSMPAFSMHVRTHSQGCKCQYCGKCFSRPWLLQGHIRTHTGEKPFRCDVCEKAFADKSNLRAHIQTHSNTKPHTCSRCGKAFALKSYLYKHEESSCMKNRSAERETRHGPRALPAHVAAAAAPVPPKSETLSQSELGLSQGLGQPLAGAGADSAKSTLAHKLLQKEKERRQAALAFSSYSASQHSGGVGAGETQLLLLNPLPSGQHQLTTEEFERFQRISVIQPTSTALPHPSAVYQEHLPPSVYHHHHHHHHYQAALAGPASGAGAGAAQDQPVDFSPKNNFTHSAKTSPFELTGNYAMVA